MNLAGFHLQNDAKIKDNINDKSALAFIEAFNTFNVIVHFLHFDRIEMEDQKQSKNHHDNYLGKQIRFAGQKKC